MIQGMDLVGDGNAGGNKMINGYHNLRIYSRKFGKQQESILVSDLYVWRDTKYVLVTSRQLGKYLQSSLPPAAWRVVP